MDRRRDAQDSSAIEEVDRAKKRRKQSNEPRSAPAASGVLPQEVFDVVWNHQERHRHIRTAFEQLPSKDDYPDYYTKIANPISLAEIKAKLDKSQYAGAHDIKKDMFLMSDNGVLYNKPKSQIYNDSLRIRRLVEGLEQPSSAGARRDAEAQPTPGRTSTRGSKGGPAAFQQAMLRIIDDLMGLEHQSGGVVAQAFKNLPSKKYYAEYYRVIARPISLSQIRSKVSQGKYDGWSGFEDDVLLIRKNAEEYNAEGSDIVKDARTLETYLLRRLHDEKVKLGDPASSGIKLRLNLGPEQPPPTAPKIKLNINSRQASAANQTPSRANGAAHSPTSVASSSMSTPLPQAASMRSSPQPAPRPPPPPPVTHAAGHNSGQQGSRAPHATTVTVLPAARAAATPPRPRLDSIKPHSPPTRTRSETPHSNNSNHLAAAPQQQQQQQQQHCQQRLSSTPKPAAGFSPMPLATVTPTPGPTLVPQAFQQASYANYHQEPVFRPEGKGKSDALISNLRITSTSVLNPAGEPFVRDLEPDSRKVTAQYFMHLPGEFDTVAVTPTLAPGLTGRDMYIVRVVHWSNNIQLAKQIAPSGQHHKNEPIYHIRLHGGMVNTVEVTAVTQAPKTPVPPMATATTAMPNGVNGFAGGAVATGVERWEMERFRVFVSSLQQ